MRGTFYGLLVLFCAFSLSTQATHLVGGQLEMRAVGDVPGHFRVVVTNYFENNNRAAGISNAPMGIYRKRDHVLMTSFTANETATTQRAPIIYTNAFCATQRSLDFITATFIADIQLPPALYTDSQGYYIAYQTRNRNGAVNNLANPLNTGFTFYLEFPPLSTTGKYLNNSSPAFAPVNGEYVCLNEPFTFPFGGTDPDGDELRYSMAEPLNQRNTNNSVASGPYPTVSFASGFSGTNAIPGNPALTVEARTGQLLVTASQVGLFVFAVLVEEYRNGQKIGEVRRDFQLLVVDCPKTQAPDPVAQIKNLPLAIAKTTLCPGESATLVVTDNANWNYQWQRDGLNVPNATASSLVVKDKGVYTVQVSLKNACTKASDAQSLTIQSLNTTPTLDAKGQLCATDGSVTLSIRDTPDMLIQWLRNGLLLASPTTDQLITQLPGTYQARLTHNTLGCTVLSEARTLTRAPAITATIGTSSGLDRICPNGQLDLLAGGGTQYQWAENGQPMAPQPTTTYTTQRTGTFSLTATDANGCIGTSPPLSLSAVPPVAPTMTVLPPMCGTIAADQPLVGTPASGTFAGPGVVGAVVGATFSPAQAGVGTFALSYSLRPAPECPAVTTTQSATVYAIPTIALSTTMLTFRGNSFTIKPNLTGDPIRFLWLPGTYLRDPTDESARVEDIRNTITYTLLVENAGSCPATASIQISVVDRLYVPTAFTPNADGQHDVWQFTNAAAYPDLDVTVFNRWGNVIFHATGPDQPLFDGTLNGEDLPAGVYTYLIRPAPAFSDMRGSVLLLR